MIIIKNSHIFLILFYFKFTVLNILKVEIKCCYYYICYDKRKSNNKMDQHITKLKQLNEEYELKSKNETNFENQKEIVKVLSNMNNTIDKIYRLHRSANTLQTNKLEFLCESHEWEIDTSMNDGHTSRYCVKCGKYI